MITNLFKSIGPILEQYLSNDSNLNLLISPFISIDAVEKLLKKSNNVVIITSWRKDHLISGVSTIELYPLCERMGWKLAINDKLHAKIYSSDLTDCYITSANCTNKALYDAEGNIECISYVDNISAESRIEINRIILESTIVTKELYEKYKEWLNKLDDVSLDDVPDPPSPIKSDLYIHHLPATDNPHYLKRRLDGESFEAELMKRIDHDISLFGTLKSYEYPEDYLDCVDKTFFKHPFIKEISKNITNEGLSFGKLSTLIHNLCMDVPCPYRKDIKTAVHNIMSWFCTLRPDEYYVTVPGRHSEVLFRR